MNSSADVSIATRLDMFGLFRNLVCGKLFLLIMDVYQRLFFGVSLFFCSGKRMLAANIQVAAVER